MEYLAGKRAVFDVALDPRGTAFEQQVWAYVRTIPYGQTRTPRQVAEAIGHAGAWRAVGMAAAKNPLPVFIPTHRVVSASGAAANGKDGAAEKFLLKLEQTSGR